MVVIRSQNEIIQNLIDFFKLVQNNLDVKPGTVARDLFIDSQASVLSTLYNELGSVSSQQSLRLVVGSDLDKLGKNFGLARKQSTPATGVALLTFSSISVNININIGDTVIANNGFSYSVTAGLSITPASSNFYRSIANKFSDQLSLAGISDPFAVEVTVKATTSGTAGNIGSYSLSRTTISGVSNVTNVNPFVGGTDQESDVNFRNRILSSFSGSSVGTALGYLNVALGVTGVSDSYIVTPGDPLMTRDGTIVKINSDGSRTIVSEGSGGKVDVVVLGTNLIENQESFIYSDKSNNNDPTNVRNNVVLGQIVGDANKTINRKRIDDIANGTLPAQPVNEILEVSGSISGNNFIAQSIDSLGRVSGNFQLLKDTGIYAGSPWGFDTFHWISNKISLFSEDIIKGLFNGQDQLTFPDVLDIPQIQQNLSITNENSIVTSDRSIIQLLHTPATNVTRVFNVHTGERYIIADQNPDKTGTFNTTGRIKISGNTLPSQSDPLQVDYSWIVNYDEHSDYDGLLDTQNIRVVNDSIDWGYASNIRKEVVRFTKDNTNNLFAGVASAPISTIANVNTYLEVDGVVFSVTSGTFVNRLAITLTNLANAVTSVDSILFKNNNSELYNTAQNDGTFTNSKVIVGINILNNITIILPSDTIAIVGDKASIFLNGTNVFNSNTVNGSFNNNQITIPDTLLTTTANNIDLQVNYIANISDLFSSSTTQLPTSRIGNGYVLNSNNGFNNFSITNITRRENQLIQKNTSNQLYIELSLSSTEYTLNSNQVISVIRLSDNKELWNSNNLGTVVIGVSGNYQLIFSGFNTPVLGDSVLIIYSASDIKRFQPFSYSNSKIKSKLDVLGFDSISGKLSLSLNSFTNESGLSFTINEPNTDIVLFNITDGYLIYNEDGTANISSLTVNFSTLPDLVNKKLKLITNNSQNTGYYDITSYNVNTNIIVITNVLNKITTDNIMIVRISDGQEIWNYNGTIDIANNRLLIPTNNNIIHSGDNVYIIIYRYKGLRRAPTKIIGTTVDQVINTGTINVVGTSLSKAEDIIFTATNTGLKLNIGEAIRKALNLNSTAGIPTNIRLARVVKVEKVITESISSDEVLESLVTYDVKNTTLQNNLLYLNDMLVDNSLQSLDFVLPNTTNNSLNTSSSHNLPNIGDKIRISFYYTTDNDLESLAYTKNGSLYTNKKFAFINKMYAASGFKTSQSTKFTATSFTQPTLGSRYKAFYDYTAPKVNERILVRYNYNQIISDVTFAIESTRPINADVLVRQAKELLLDLTINVVINSNYTSSQTTVLQNLRDQLISALTTNKLGQVIDAITLINIAQGVTGIDRARILYFNKTGLSGQVLIIQAQNDEYFTSNNIVINTETR